MNNKIDITFICYAYKWDEGIGTMFLFYPEGIWDENKLTLEEALQDYPPTKYEWIHSDE